MHPQNSAKNKRFSFSNSRYLPKTPAPGPLLMKSQQPYNCRAALSLHVWLQPPLLLQVPRLKEENLKHTLTTTCELKRVFIVVKLHIFIMKSQVRAIWNKSLWFQTSTQDSPVIATLVLLQPLYIQLSASVSLPELSPHNMIRWELHSKPDIVIVKRRL